MGRPRIRPRRLYRALDSGVYFDQELGHELTYIRQQTILPSKGIEGISLTDQEKMARKLTRWGVFETFGYEDQPQAVEDEPRQP